MAPCFFTHPWKAPLGWRVQVNTLNLNHVNISSTCHSGSLRLEADVDAVFPNLDCLTSETTGCNSIQDGLRLESWGSCYEKMGQRNKQDYRGVSLKDEHVCRVRCLCSHKHCCWNGFSVRNEGFAYRFETPNWTSCPRSFPRQAWKDEGQCLKSKDGRPYEYIAGFKAFQDHRTTRHFSTNCLWALFVGSRAALCLVRWRARTSDGWWNGRRFFASSIGWD